MQVKFIGDGDYVFCYGERGQRSPHRSSILLVHGFTSSKDQWNTAFKVGTLPVFVHSVTLPICLSLFIMPHCPFVCSQCHTAQLCVFVHNATCNAHLFFFVNNITVPICLSFGHSVTVPICLSLFTVLHAVPICLCSQCCMQCLFVCLCSQCSYAHSLSLFTMSHCPNTRHSHFWCSVTSVWVLSGWRERNALWGLLLTAVYQQS